MMRFVLVNGGLVIQAVELDPSWQMPNLPTSWTPPDGVAVVASDTAGIGWTYDGATFTPPSTPPPPPPTPDQLRAATFVAQTDRQDLVSRLQSATPVQIDTWLTNNVTTLAQARAVLGAIIKVLATQQLS